MELMMNWWLGNIYLILFWVFYKLLLGTTTSFNWNRSYLLLAPIVAFSLPFVGKLFPTPVEEAPVPSYMLETITVISEKTGPVAADNSLHWWTWLYIIGITLFLVRFLWTSKHLSSLILGSKKEKKSGFTLLKSNTQLSSFSFFRYVHIQPNLNKDQQQAVLRHELVHVNSGHSFDILFFELLVILLWLNPVVFLYRSAIREVHEFVADKVAAKRSKSDYSKMLVAQAMGVTPAVIVNPFFNQSLLKRRIMMLNKKSKNSTWKYVFILPMAFAMFYMASCTKGEDASSNPAMDVEKKAMIKDDGVIQPEFDGGMNAMFQYIGDKLKYPKEAKEAGSEGKVYVKFTVTEEGQIKDAHVVKGVDEYLDNAALNVVKGMPNWTPGMKDGKPVAIEYTLPLSFVLE